MHSPITCHQTWSLGRVSQLVVGAGGRLEAVSRFQALTDEQWERIELLLPSNAGKVGRPFGDHRTVVEGIAYRYRTGIPWRDVPREAFGPWQTVWKRHKKFAADGTWDRILAHLMAEADAAGQIDWTVSVDSTINRAHQHATNTTRPEQATGGDVESQEPRGPGRQQ
ncbi:transposase [Cellulosimicrobium cellulans]|nr:transposase [Cellulosimicrobium cellulans]